MPQEVTYRPTPHAYPPVPDRSEMVYSLIPNRDHLQQQLDSLCHVCHAVRCHACQINMRDEARDGVRNEVMDEARDGVRNEVRDEARDEVRNVTCYLLLDTCYLLLATCTAVGRSCVI